MQGGRGSPVHPAMVMASTTAQYRSASGQRLIPGQTVRMTTGALNLPGVPPASIPAFLGPTPGIIPENGPASPHQRVRTLPSNFPRKLGPGKIETSKSLVLVLHSAVGLEVMDPAAFSAKRIFAIVSMGKTQVRTPTVHESHSPGSLDLNFVIRMPFEPGTVLAMKLVDSLTSATVAEGSISQFSTDEGNISISAVPLSPKGEMRYHVRLSEAPTGSASVQRLATQTYQTQTSSLTTSNTTNTVLSVSAATPSQGPSTVHSGDSLLPPGFTQVNSQQPRLGTATIGPIGGTLETISGGFEPFLFPGTPGTANSGLLSPAQVQLRPQFNTVGEIATAQYFPGSTSPSYLRPAGTISPPTYIGPDGRTRVATSSLMRGPANCYGQVGSVAGSFTPVDRASIATRGTLTPDGAELIVGSQSGSRIIRAGHTRTRSEAPGTTTGLSVARKILGSDLGASASPLRPQASQNLQNPEEAGSSVKSASGHVRAFSLGPGVVGQRSSLFPPTVMSTSPNAVAGVSVAAVGRLESTLIPLSQLPKSSLTPPAIDDSGLGDVTEVLKDLRDEHNSATLPKIRLVHPFKAVSLRVGGHIVDTRQRITMAAISSANSTLRALEIVPVASTQSQNGQQVLALLPLELQHTDCVVRIVAQARRDQQEFVEIPVRALLKRCFTEFRGKIKMTNCGPVPPSQPSTLRFSYKLLKFPVPAPMAYDLPIGFTSLLVGHSKLLNPMVTQNPEQSKRQPTIPDSTPASKSEGTSDIAAALGSSDAAIDKKEAMNSLIVTVSSIDDTNSKVPLTINGESTKDIYCKVSLGSTTALRAKFVNWRSPGKRLPDFEFPYGEERVLKICFVGTASNTKVNLGTCRIDLHTLLKTGHLAFRGFIPMVPGEGIAAAPQVTVNFKFGRKDTEEGGKTRTEPAATGSETSTSPQTTSLAKPSPSSMEAATTWDQVLVPNARVSLTINKISGDDLSRLRAPFCLRISCGKFRVKSNRHELPATPDLDRSEPAETSSASAVNTEPAPKEFTTPIKIDWIVKTELLETLKFKPLVLGLYVKNPETGIHGATQFCRMQPQGFHKGFESQTAEAETEMLLAPGIPPNEPLFKIDYTMEIVLSAQNPDQSTETQTAAVPIGAASIVENSTQKRKTGDHAGDE